MDMMPKNEPVRPATQAGNHPAGRLMIYFGLISPNSPASIQPAPFGVLMK